MQIDKRSREELKKYFAKNAIPTASNFAEFIDGMLSQKDDGIAKPSNGPLSIEAVGDDTSQKPTLHLYEKFSDPNPAWVLSLNPRQDPANAATARPGLSISDSAGTSRLFIDRGTGNVGVGTISPSGAKLHVAGTVKANRFTSDNALVLNDYATTRPASNIYLQAPTDDRDAWVYLDTNFNTNDPPHPNWGIYHRQINSTVNGLPANSIGFIGNSKLQAYIGLADGSAFFAGNTSIGGQLTVTGLVQANGKLRAVGNGGSLDIEGVDHAYIQWYPMKATAGRKGWIGYGGVNTTTMTINNEAGELQLTGKDGVRVNGDVEFENTVGLGWARVAPNFDAPLRNGFYNADRPVGGLPDTTHGWHHLIAVRHANAGNHHQLQIASTYTENDRLFFRKIARDLTDANRSKWNEVATVTNGVLKIGNWTIEATADHLFIKKGTATVARFSTTWDRFHVYRNINGAAPYFFFNEGGAFGQHVG